MKNIFVFGIALIPCIAIYATDPQGALSGKFSLSETKQVQFAKGNLQYHCKNQEWRFAESQLTTLGSQNENISDTYDGWIDLFGWSTASTNYGVSTSKELNDYNGEFVDWGTKIGTGWRTLTLEELRYLLGWRSNGRTDFANKWGVAQVDGVNGLIILPDDWKLPDDIAAFFTFKSGKSSESDVSGFAAQNTYTKDQWKVMEESGAVFLPITGLREGNSILSDELTKGYYWAATSFIENDETCVNLTIQANSVLSSADSPWLGMSVRLVYDEPSSTPTAIEQTTEFTVYAVNGYIACPNEAQIFDLFGRNVTRLNGSLNGVYIVKVGEKAQKIVVK